jgi:hypothetical protein
MMRMFAAVLFVLLSSNVWATQTITGNLMGSFSGQANDGSGSYTGNIEGEWSAAGGVDDAGVFIESVTGSGSFGGLGLSGTWNIARYDAVAKTISVVWNGPGGRGPVSIHATGEADGKVDLILDITSGTATGNFVGQIYTPAGIKTVSGTWTVQFQGLANATVTGSVPGSFSGNASYVGAVSGEVSGAWAIRIMPDGSVVGSASGRYDGGNVDVAGYGSVCICGTWLAHLTQGDDGRYQLAGSWTHPVVSGTLAGSGGGPLLWYLDLSTAPAQASGNFDGQVSFQATVPILGTMAIPITVGGDWTATLPINP